MLMKLSIGSLSQFTHTYQFIGQIYFVPVSLVTKHTNRIKNPIQHCGARELEKTYHPYDKFALDTAAMSARVNPKNPRLYQLEIEDVTNPICADELERLLVLSERWSNRMKDSLERDKSALVAGRVHEVIDEGGEISEDTVRSKLSAMAKSREREKGKRANALLEKAVLDFQVDHEVNEIFSTLEQIDGFRRY